MQARPKGLREFLARHEIPRLPQQHFQNSKWFVLQPDSDAAFAQFSLREIGFEFRKTNFLRWQMI
jgi:hypothetical protein